MYPNWVFHVINVVVAFWILVGCMKKKVKASDGQKTLQTTPISYETDPVQLEKERKQKVAENRARMRKKREKMNSKEFSRFAALVENQKASRETMLQEDSTQPSCTEESNESSGMPSGDDIVMEQTNPQSSGIDYDEGYKIAHMRLTSESENLGDIRLVDSDPHDVKKHNKIKKQARDAAKQKQFEEQLRKGSSSEEELRSPDDTLKNVSSIQYESQLSVVQKKKLAEKAKTNPDDTESKTKVAELIEPKSNELYARELAAKVVGH